MQRLTDYISKNPLKIFKLYIFTFIVFLFAVIYLIQQENKIETNYSDNSFSVNTVEVIDNDKKSKVVYEILGQVKNPGVYYSNQGIIVLDAIEKAGGITIDGDLEYIHKNISLSKPIINYQKIYIPSRQEKTIINSDSNLTNLININNSSKSELENLPGIGEITAQKIIDNRPYSSIEDLKNVSGIGDSLYNKIVTLIEI